MKKRLFSFILVACLLCGIAISAHAVVFPPQDVGTVWFNADGKTMGNDFQKNLTDANVETALKERLRELQPGAEIVFVTGHAEHAVEAWAVHARGYVLKPVTPERLREEVKYVLSLRPGMTPGRPSAHIEVKTFGSFDVLVDGEPVHFRRAKAKELLAYLVEKQGQSITREKAFLALWEGRPYDRPGQKQLDVILRSLRGTLDEYGIGGILSLRRGAISVVPRMFSCDMYRFVLGDAAAIGEYRGEYMTAYSWASLREAYLERRIENLKDPAVSGSADSADPQRR